MAGTILLIDDEQTQQIILKAMLGKFGYDARIAASGIQAEKFLDERNRKYIDLILLDLYMPEISGLEVLEKFSQKYPDIPIIVLTGSTDIKEVVTAMKLGAIDFINKPPDPEHLRISIKNALKISSLSREVARLRRKEAFVTNFEDIVGYDGGLAKIVEVARKAAKSDIPVLVSGETGTGKELFARAIHGESSRAGRPFIAVNCGAIPVNLVESILFGHEKGAFTGATEKNIGKFKEADGGTIFLDEIGELPLDMQVKLLRVLQQKEIEPVGSSKTKPVDIRIISATNRNLASEVEIGNFREDLYFRLNVLNIELPSLKDRAEDVIYLVHHFIERFSASENIPIMMLTKKAEDFLISHNWPGNVRELENIVHRAIVLAEKDILDLEDFAYAMSHRDDDMDNTNNSSPYNISMLLANGDLKAFKSVESEAIKIALKYHNNNVTRAAKSLNIAKSTFYKKMKR